LPTQTNGNCDANKLIACLNGLFSRFGVRDMRRNSSAVTKKFFNQKGKARVIFHSKFMQTNENIGPVATTHLQLIKDFGASINLT
jgi:hypothetical protein